MRKLGPIEKSLSNIHSKIRANPRIELGVPIASLDLLTDSAICVVHAQSFQLTLNLVNVMNTQCLSLLGHNRSCQVPITVSGIQQTLHEYWLNDACLYEGIHLVAPSTSIYTEQNAVEKMIPRGQFLRGNLSIILSFTRWKWRQNFRFAVMRKHYSFVIIPEHLQRKQKVLSQIKTSN